MGRPRGFPATAWSPSRFATLRRCPREHRLKYRDNIRPKGSSGGARAIGSYTHDVLEHVGNTCLAGGEADAVAYEAARQFATDRCEDPAALIEGARLIAAYRLRYGDVLAGWDGYELVAVEKVLLASALHARLGGFAAIADVVVRDSDGIWVVERKTAGRQPSGSDEAIVKSVRTRPQFQSLAYCGRDTYGDDFRGVIFDQLTKTKVVNFVRLKIPRDDAELNRFAENQESLEAMADLDCQNLDACDPPMGFRCDYFNYCHGTEEEREQLFQIRLAA